jgi:hypothetical protein
MKTVLIDDMRSDIQVLAVDLRNVLAALGQRATKSDWRVRQVWATDADGDSRSAAVLASFDGSQIVSGERLRELAEDVIQVIDGVFSGFEPGTTEPWAIIEAVDSSYYLVRSNDPSVLEIIRKTFQRVSDYEKPVT